MKDGIVSGEEYEGGTERENEGMELIGSLLARIALEREVVNPVLLNLRATQRAVDNEYRDAEGWRQPQEKAQYSFDRKSACPIDDHRRKLLREVYYDWDTVREGSDETLFDVVRELFMLRPLSMFEHEAKDYVYMRLCSELETRVRGKFSAMGIDGRLGGLIQDGEDVRAVVVLPAGSFSQEEMQKYRVTSVAPRDKWDKAIVEYHVPLMGLCHYLKCRSEALTMGT